MTWLVPLALAVVLGSVGITRQAWRDEHATWQAASSTWPVLVEQLSRMDIVFAPYYVFMKGWMALFGDSVVAMRVPSVLAMAAAAGLVSVLGQRLFDPWVGLIGGSLFAALPSVSRYAQEARPYAMAIAFAVLSVLAVLSAVGGASRGGSSPAASSWRAWALVSLSVTLTGLSHLIALLVLVAHIPIVLARSGGLGDGGRDSEDPRVFGESVGIKDDDSRTFPERVRILAGGRRAKALAEGAPDMVRPRHMMGRWAVAIGVGLLPVLALLVLGARQAGQVSWIDAGWKNLATLPMSLSRSAVVAGVVASLAVVGVLASRWDWRITLLLTWAAAPPLILFALARDLFFYRYLLFTLPAWTLLAGVGVVAAARERRRALAAVALAVIVLGLGARDHLAVRRSPLRGDQDYRAAAAYVRAHQAPGDLIIFDGYPDERERLAFGYELRGGPAPRECAACLATASRLWLVTNGAAAHLDGFVPAQTGAFSGITVTLLQRAT